MGACARRASRPGFRQMARRQGTAELIGLLIVQPKHAVCSFSPSMLSVHSAQACCLFFQLKHAVCSFSPSMLSVYSAQACCLFIQPKHAVCTFSPSVSSAWSASRKMYSACLHAFGVYCGQHHSVTLRVL